ncbi:MAG: zinc-ribbon domain-containing protein [Caldilineae bacterium]|nr:MAG: zinc-ribbon domain-containing protein [Caldilineae bacterium]
MPADLTNTIATILGVIVAMLGAFLFAFWVAMGIWTFNDIRSRTRDWLAIGLACLLVLVFPVVGLIIYLMIRPKDTLADVYDRALEEEALLRELEETLTCHHCGAPVKDEWIFCPHCHAQLQYACPTCNQAVRQEWDICVYCGTPQHASSTAAREAVYAQGPSAPPTEETLGYRPVQMGE